MLFKTGLITIEIPERDGQCVQILAINSLWRADSQLLTILASQIVTLSDSYYVTVNLLKMKLVVTL